MTLTETHAEMEYQNMLMMASARRKPRGPKQSSRKGGEAPDLEIGAEETNSTSLTGRLSGKLKEPRVQRALAEAFIGASIAFCGIAYFSYTNEEE